MSSPTRRSASAEPRAQSSSPPPLTRRGRMTNMFDTKKDLSRSSSTESEYFDTVESGEGLLPILQNLQYCMHKSLTKSNSEQLKKADKILKRDSNKALENALKTERSRMGSQIINFLNGSSISNIEQDIPQCPPFDDNKLACPEIEFERHLKSIQRQYPKYSQKSAELQYFLTDIFEMRESFNFTDRQLVRILSNRFTDRLLSHFLTEIKRDDVVNVVNKMAHRYIKTVNSSEEVDRYLNFSFKFRNLGDEITELRQTMALAHPKVDVKTLETMFLEKVLSLLPHKARHALLDDISKRLEMVKLGLVSRPYDENELDARIMYHCRGLDKNVSTPHKREVRKVSERDVHSSEEQKTNDVSVDNFQKYDDRFLSILNEVKKIKISTKKVSDLQDQVFALNLQNAEILASKVPAEHHKDERSSRSNVPAKRFKNYEKKPFLRNPRSPTPKRNESHNDIVKIGMKDPRYSQFVDQIKKDQNFKYVGQKLKNDYYAATSDLRQELNQIRANKPKNRPVYQWAGNKYKISRKHQIKFPVFKKRGNGTPDLTPEALKHFAEVCHACGIRQCPGRHSAECAYYQLPDSWYLCTSCECGLHLSKDCRALLTEN
jgi:hypothetical protein